MKLLAFRAHKHDPLSSAIMAVTRSSYCHGAVLLEGDERKLIPEPADFTSRQTNYLIAEEYWPSARARFLDADELAAIDVFEIVNPGFDPARAAGYAAGEIKDHLPYDWPDLFRFIAPIRAVVGEAAADAAKRHMFCSMFVYHIALAGGIRLLNCHDYEFSPDKLDWSPYTVPAETLA
jgi:hypothetical protein